MHVQVMFTFEHAAFSIEILHVIKIAQSKVANVARRNIFFANPVLN